MYKLVFLKSAQKEFKKIDKVMQKHIENKLRKLAKNPDILQNNITPLKGNHKGKFRLRVLEYRVVFQVKNKELLIIIVRIAHRKEVY